MKDSSGSNDTYNVISFRVHISGNKCEFKESGPDLYRSLADRGRIL